MTHCRASMEEFELLKVTTKIQIHWYNSNSTADMYELSKQIKRIHTDEKQKMGLLITLLQ